jgi:hypothetical protein
MNRADVLNSPICIAINTDGTGIECNKKAQFVLQYKIQGRLNSDPYCNEHAIDRLDYLRHHLQIKDVKVLKFKHGITKEKVTFT